MTTSPARAGGVLFISSFQTLKGPSPLKVLVFKKISLFVRQLTGHASLDISVMSRKLLVDETSNAHEFPYHIKTVESIVLLLFPVSGTSNRFPQSGSICVSADHNQPGAESNQPE